MARLLVLLDNQCAPCGTRAFYQMEDKAGANIQSVGIDVMLHEDSIYLIMDFGRIAGIGFNDIIRSLDLTYSQYASKGNKMIVQLF